jgi:hypothetical protein
MARCASANYDAAPSRIGLTGQHGDLDPIPPATCYANDVEVIAAIRSISAYSHIFFRWDAAGICTIVQVHTSSTGIP